MGKIFLMAYRGFLIESKSYMNYPHCGRWYFWSRFPFAWIGFHWLGFKYWLDAKYVEVKYRLTGKID